MGIIPLEEFSSTLYWMLMATKASQAIVREHALLQEMSLPSLLVDLRGW